MEDCCFINGHFLILMQNKENKLMDGSSKIALKIYFSSVAKPSFPRSALILSGSISFLISYTPSSELNFLKLSLYPLHTNRFIVFFCFLLWFHHAELPIGEQFVSEARSRKNNWRIYDTISFCSRNTYILIYIAFINYVYLTFLSLSKNFEHKR